VAEQLDHIQAVGHQKPAPSNRRLQLTAFGARDRWHFDSFRRASAAAEAQDVGWQPSTLALF